jgi:hypothetical protein
MVSKLSRSDPDPDPDGSKIIWPPGFESIIQDLASASGSKEIFTDPRHWSQQKTYKKEPILDAVNMVQLQTVETFK